MYIIASLNKGGRNIKASVVDYGIEAGSLGNEESNNGVELSSAGTEGNWNMQSLGNVPEIVNWAGWFEGFYAKSSRSESYLSQTYVGRRSQ